MTRLLLCPAHLWLLDEPTSSMDEATEERCLVALKRHIREGQTLVMVTHKARLLDLVDRLPDASIAALIASSRSWSRKGLVRNSMARAFIACTAISTSA